MSAVYDTAFLADCLLGQLEKKHSGLGIEMPPVWAQALNVVGEAGEFAEAFRRYTGHARRAGSLDEVEAELADVVISAFVFAYRAGIDLNAALARKGEVVLTRGVRDSRD